MAVDKLVDSALLDAALGDIADVIRSKTGISGSFDFPTPNDIADVIDLYLLMPTGTKSITQNGTNIDVAQYSKVDVNVSGGGGATIKSGTYTPAEDIFQVTFDIEDSTLQHFLLYALSTPYGNSKRVGSLAFLDFENSQCKIITSNSTGANPSTSVRWAITNNWSDVGITRTGSQISFASYNSASAFDYFIGGITYKWIAW